MRHFRGADDEIAIGSERIGEAIQDACFGLRFEIEQYVAAEDDIHLAEEAVIVEQIEGAEFDHAAQMFGDTPVFIFLRKMGNEAFDAQATLNLERGVETF